jgi:hypothetical protein
MLYCTTAEVTKGNPDLTAAHVAPLLGDLIAEATDMVRDQIGAFCDISYIEDTGPIPHRINRLAVYKARELGYIAYLAGEVSERGPVQENRQIFDGLVGTLAQDVKAGRLDRNLQPSDLVEREARFI